MRIAVIADIHANLLALDAVLEEAAGMRPDRVVCLGDLVGYNAEPRGCIARVRATAHVIVAGNHDRDAAGADAHPGTEGTARAAQRWTRERLDLDDLAFLQGLPRLIDDAELGVVAVHGCWLNDVHTYGYATGTMLEANLVAIAERSGQHVGLCGHTHMPMVGWLGRDGCHEIRTTSARWPSAASAVLINPGSVGQPRDGDPRASFAMVDVALRSVEIHRVAYDVARAAQAVVDAGLPPSLAARLLEGR
jgi:predicted phosphodiesterase